MDENKQNFNTLDSSHHSSPGWHRPVMFFYIKTTSWIILPLILGLILGKYIGESAGSQTLFFGIIFLGFLITCYGIYREVKTYLKDLEKQKNKKNDQLNSK
ncbi:MAG: hypothetical protein WCW93_01225 [Candidatus Paceibacterota bacterium]